MAILESPFHGRRQTEKLIINKSYTVFTKMTLQSAVIINAAHNYHFEEGVSKVIANLCNSETSLCSYIAFNIDMRCFVMIRIATHTMTLCPTVLLNW